MNSKNPLRWIFILILIAGLIVPANSASAQSEVTAYDLIIAMNTLRTSYGLPALIEDPIIDAVAQATAETMAASNMSWHIGNVSGRLASAGYGGGATVWGTENFAVGSSHSIDTIMLVWSDDSHMIPAVNPAYCNVGAGTALASNGMTYYVLQAAYTSNKACGEYKSPSGSGSTNAPGGSTDQGRVPGVSQLIVPVKIATPDADGNIYHVVEAGQSFWSIAVAYKITIKDLETWNNLSSKSSLQLGQKLFIPGPNTKGYATPTPIGMIVPNKPDEDGKIVHTVASYQTLSTIADAYKTDVDTLLRLNNWQVDWALQIGQKLLVDPGKITPSPTPRPLTPIEKLTPAADGKYYHTVKSGENLSYIADLYKVNVNDIIAWNGMGDGSILMPEQKLVLQVTPPATITPTPAPATVTASPTTAPPTPTPSRTATLAPSATSTPAGPDPDRQAPLIWGIIGGVAGLGLFVVIFFSLKRR